MAAKKNIKQTELPDGRVILYDEDGKTIGKQILSRHAQKRIAQGKKPVDYSGITVYSWKKNKNGVSLFVHRDMDADALHDDYQLFPQTEEMMMCVVQMVADGKTLRTIGQVPGLPPISVVMRWCAKDENFKTALDEARKSRAEVYHDAIEHVAFHAKETNARSSKVKIDALKFLASVNDKDKFGNQAKIAIDASQPINIIFHTGIERDKPIDVEATPPLELDKIVPSKGD